MPHVKNYFRVTLTKKLYQYRNNPRNRGREQGIPPEPGLKSIQIKGGEKKESQYLCGKKRLDSHFPLFITINFSLSKVLNIYEQKVKTFRRKSL